MVGTRSPLTNRPVTIWHVIMPGSTVTFLNEDDADRFARPLPARLHIRTSSQVSPSEYAKLCRMAATSDATTATVTP